MADWQSADMSELVPSELAELVSSASDISDKIVTTLELVKGWVLLAGGNVSYVHDFASVLTELVKKFRTDFLGTGFYACNMWDYPLKQYYRSGSSGEIFSQSFLSDLSSSLTDAHDPNVPTFEGNVAMLVIVGTATGLDQIVPTIKIARDAFFNWKELSAITDSLVIKTKQLGINDYISRLQSGEIKSSERVAVQSSKVQQLERVLRDVVYMTLDAVEAITIVPNPTLKDVEDLITYVNTNVASSTYPDWESVTLRKILPPVVDIVDVVLEPLIGTLQSGTDTLKAIQELIALVEIKIAQLQAINARMATYLSQFVNLISMTGLYTLWVTSSTGVVPLASSLLDATSTPFGTSNGFYYGVTLLAGGAGLAPFENLFRSVGT